MSVKIPDARKKRKSKIQLKNPLPIPCHLNKEEKPGESSISTIFRGVFMYGAIIIEDYKFSETLWENGFFGDGNLSSSGLKYKFNIDTKTESQVKRINDWFRDAAHQNKESNLQQEAIHPPGNISVQNEEEIPVGKSMHLKEVLHLCPEEALFLSYALGVLILENESGMEMDIDDMWDAFWEMDPHFPLLYAVYHHFRCKGWVVKPGVKFGADWVLYPVGPPFYHSQFLVWIQCLWKETLEEDTFLSDRRSDIADISALERLSGHVGKTVLLCQVLRPLDLTEEGLKSIDCLRRFIISEVVLQRWTPNAEIAEPSTSTKTSAQTSKKEKRPAAASLQTSEAQKGSSAVS